MHPLPVLYQYDTSSERGICEGAMNTEERSELAVAEEEGKSGGENAEERREERGERKYDNFCFMIEKKLIHGLNIFKGDLKRKFLLVQTKGSVD